MSMGWLLLGLFSAFLMHPETPFEEDVVAPPAAGALPAGYKNR
jgi:hypothetical protein